MTNFIYFELRRSRNHTSQATAECFPQALLVRAGTSADENESFAVITAAPLCTFISRSLCVNGEMALTITIERLRRKMIAGVKRRVEIPQKLNGSSFSVTCAQTTSTPSHHDVQLNFFHCCWIHRMRNTVSNHHLVPKIAPF